MIFSSSAERERPDGEPPPSRSRLQTERSRLPRSPTAHSPNSLEHALGEAEQVSTPPAARLKRHGLAEKPTPSWVLLRPEDLNGYGVIERSESGTLKIQADKSMFDAVESLMLDLLEWIANGERSYDEVMDAWRTSCPRFPVWEDANDRGLVAKQHLDGRIVVKVTPSGLALLEQRNPSPRSRAM
jgi:hypothetical protein